jgi:hypothetical protein
MEHKETEIQVPATPIQSNKPKYESNGYSNGILDEFPEFYNQ